MSHFLYVLFATVFIGISSLILFALCVKQVNSACNFSIIEAFNDVNTVIRKLKVLWKQDRRTAVLTGMGTLLYFYWRLKTRNTIGSIDASIVSALAMVLMATATVGFYDVVHELIMWMKSKKV